MSALAAHISAHFNVPLDARDLALTVIAAPVVLAGLIAGLVLLAAVAG